MALLRSTGSAILVKFRVQGWGVGVDLRLGWADESCCFYELQTNSGSSPLQRSLFIETFTPKHFARTARRVSFANSAFVDRQVVVGNGSPPLKLDRTWGQGLAIERAGSGAYRLKLLACAVSQVRSSALLVILSILQFPLHIAP